MQGTDRLTWLGLDDDLVGDTDGCPYCLERREDWLVWLDDGETIECATCGATYTLD